MFRMTEEEFNATQARIGRGARKAVSRDEALAKSAEKKAKGTGRNKYGAKKTTVDNIVFDSKAEAQRYSQLKAMEKAGQIVDLRIQVEFQLLPAQEKDGHKERAVKYVADFTYRDRDGKHVVEDVKSGPTKTREFILKRKMMMFFHSIAVREVLVGD